MSNKKFTEEEIKILESNEYVKKVTQLQIMFTEEFKKKYVSLINSGTSAKGSLISMGIDPNLLGKVRIECLGKRFRKQSLRPEGFTRKENSSKGVKRKISFANSEDALAYYKEYSERLEQELEFRKKIQALEDKYTAEHFRAKNMK